MLPLHCVYCSNPIELYAAFRELSTDDWSRVFREAAALAFFKPISPAANLSHASLDSSAPRAAGLYVNLITSGMPLDESRLEALVAAGLDHFQLSFQGAREEIARKSLALKRTRRNCRVPRVLKRHRVAVTLNFVISTHNMSNSPKCSRSPNFQRQPRQFANVQYYGWAFANRDSFSHARTAYAIHRFSEKSPGNAWQEKSKSNTSSDYYAKYPKPCMGGGRKLNAHHTERRRAAMPRRPLIPGLSFEKREGPRPKRIWNSSDAFQNSAANSWMQETCKTCDSRSQDSAAAAARLFF